MKPLQKLPLAVLIGLLCIFSCSKNDKSPASLNEDLAIQQRSVVRNALVKVTFSDKDYTMPIEVVSLLATNLDKLMPEAKLSKTGVALSIESSSTVKDSSESPNMYIFNFREGGYAIFSADERYSPLLAVVKKGKFEKKEVSGGLINWLDITMDQINLAKSGKLDDRKLSQAEWRKSIKAVIEGNPELARALPPVDDSNCCEECPNYPACLSEPSIGCGATMPCDGGGDPCGASNYTQKGPYLQTEWGQWWGYNDMAPNLGCNPTGPNHNAPTGCVATAMAQIMRYWAVPTPFNYNYIGMPNTDNFNWGNNTEIHRMMRNAADAVGMDWECSGSGADSDDAADALRTTFGYRSATYTNTYNQSLLLANLNYGYPAILGGYRTRTWFWPVYGYKNGHAWVCDGYYSYSNYCYSSLYLHMNWGWNGTDNGWFAYNNWQNSTGNYQYKQDMIYNILP